MNYLGKGKLIGLKSYAKDNKRKICLYGFNGNMNKSGLYDNNEVIAASFYVAP